MTQDDVDKCMQAIGGRFPNAGWGKQGGKIMFVEAMNDVEELLAELPLDRVQGAINRLANTKYHRNTEPEQIAEALVQLRRDMQDERERAAKEENESKYPLRTPFNQGDIVVTCDDLSTARVISPYTTPEGKTYQQLWGADNLFGELRWKPAWSHHRVWHATYIMDRDELSRLRKLNEDDSMVVKMMWKDWWKSGLMVMGGGLPPWHDWVKEKFPRDRKEQYHG